MVTATLWPVWCSALPNVLELTISKEAYLKAIAEELAAGEMVTAAVIARWMKVSEPAATIALKRLEADKLVAISTNAWLDRRRKRKRLPVMSCFAN